MNTPNPVPPAAITWYQSDIMRNIVAGVIAQIIARVQSRFHFDITVLGFSATDLVNWAMDGITALFVWQAARARQTQKAAPAITLTQTQANVMNAAPTVQAGGHP